MRRDPTWNTPDTTLPAAPPPAAPPSSWRGRLLERVERAEGRWERRRDSTEPLAIPPPRDRPTEEVHRLLGDSLPCATCQGFDSVWTEVHGRLPAASHHDGGRDLAEAIWTVVRHRRPELAVETGVAQGVSSAVTLAALEANGAGRLWSLDLPPAPGTWTGEVGAAVAPRLRQRWVYLRGSSRRRLGPLLARLGSLDLFLHDALHTYRSMSREFTLAWRHLRPGGALLSDDVHTNPAFVDFATTTRAPWLAIRESAGKPTAFGVALR